MYRSYIKNYLARVFGCFGILVSAPLFIIIAVAIKIDSKGPVFFTQERIGKKGLVFKIIKFRTMCVGAENQGTGLFSFEGDPRVTRIGKLLRKTSLDEIPQLINISRSEMVFVGPRPVTTYHPCHYSEYSPEQLRRFEVKPGISGWAQVNGRNSLSWEKRLELDVWYVDHVNALLDVRIILKTIAQVLLGKNTLVTKDTSASLRKSNHNAKRTS